ncbi:MAG: carboxypeptidase regulatory-like domain-containing protein, partial [Candidatus Eremiobacteraeota bacterium]|nr:carboxypeptidase regulatory-like domain-containing protein [Candidatus Eremiobacteraeota bacterium]
MSWAGATSASETARAAAKPVAANAATQAATSRMRHSQWVDMVLIIAHPSEEYVKAWIMGPLLWALAQTVAQAQPATPLIVGSLRDQSGTPISAANIKAFDASGAMLASAQSSDDGTFALTTSAATTLRIECDYCLPVTVHPDLSRPLAIVVHRFLAVMQSEPSRQDIAALPYAHAESVLSLAPYTVLEDSSGIVPGPYVSNRGLASGGGLLLDGGVPVYDVTANESPFISLPS